jgi:hypothetical protein
MRRLRWFLHCYYSNVSVARLRAACLPAPLATCLFRHIHVLVYVNMAGVNGILGVCVSAGLAWWWQIRALMICTFSGRRAVPLDGGVSVCTFTPNQDGQRVAT